jgi:D-alanyl-D-alanine carboxypeptidase
MRAVRAAQLLERGFANNGLAWLRPSLGTVDNLVPIDASPPNLREEMCGGKRKRPASDEDEESLSASAGSSSGGESAVTFFTAGLQPPMAKPSELLAGGPAASEPMLVYTGAKKTGPALIAAMAVDSEKQTTKQRGKRSRVASKKPDAAAAPKADAKDNGKDGGKDAKPLKQVVVVVGHANAKPDTAAKPAAAAADKPAPKPAKPKTAAKPKGGEAKPKGAEAKPKGAEAKPAG